MRLRWRHAVVGTKCSWLHGDPRGFRNRDHRLHSSGDYLEPPPDGEHVGLHQYHQDRSGKAVDLEIEARIVICRAIVEKWKSLGFRIIACAVGKRHLHAVVEGPDEYHGFVKEFGKAKQKASHAIRRMLPGEIWAANGGYKPVRGRGHLRNSCKYVRTRQEAGTVVWSHRQDEDWVADPSIGIIVMRGRSEPPMRLLPKPASEGTPEVPDLPTT